MPGKISFRLANPGDVDALTQFSCADRGQPHTCIVEEIIRTDVASDIASGDNELRIVLALHDDAIVGVVAHSIEDTEQHNDVHYIHVLAVRPDYRRRLIGTLLKQNVLDHAHKTGIELVASQVHRRNHPMQALNTRLNATADIDPADGDYLLTITRSESVLSGVSDDPSRYGTTGPISVTNQVLNALCEGRLDDARNIDREYDWPIRATLAAAGAVGIALFVKAALDLRRSIQSSLT